MTGHARVLAIIAASTDADQLRRFRDNAVRMGEEAVAAAAFQRLIQILPQEAPGSFEHAFWMTIHALEEVLKEERGKTVRLARTRQKIDRVGVRRCAIDLVTSTAASEGFNMLIDRELPELTAEALVLRYADEFEAEVPAAARERLQEAGVDLSRLPQA